MNQMEQIDESIGKIGKNQLGVVATLITTLATAVYGYGSITNKLEQNIQMVQEMRTEVRTLQETRFQTNEAIRQIGEIKLMLAKLDGRITYIERDGLEILAGAKINEGADSQRTHRNSD